MIKDEEAIARKARYATDPEWRAVLKERNHVQYMKNRARRIAEAGVYYRANKPTIVAGRKRFREINGDMLRERGRTAYQRHREKRLAVQRERRQSGEERLREHGLNRAEYQEIAFRQGEACAICRTPFSVVKRLCIDHDHDTNRVRGILCHNCNVGIGHLRDDLAIVEAARDYLRAWFPR